MEIKEYFSKHPFFIKKNKNKGMGTFGSNLEAENLTEQDLDFIKKYYNLKQVNKIYIDLGCSVFNENFINYNKDSPNYDGNEYEYKNKVFDLYSINLTNDGRIFFKGKLNV